MKQVFAIVLAGCSAPSATPSAPPSAISVRDDGAAPEVFAPGVVSGPRVELNAAFSPDGRTMYFSRKDGADKISTILVTRRRGDAWSEPEVAPFSGRYRDVDPMFSPDGKRLYFSSYRPRDGDTQPAADADLWFVESRGSDEFGEPVHMGTPINTLLDDLYASLTRDGALYFARWDPERATGDLFVAQPTPTGYDVTPLPAPVNTEHVEYDPFVAPDERYLLFVSSRPGGHGGGDLYVSFRDGSGWTQPRNVGPLLNTSAREYAPVVSADGQYLYFARKVGAGGDVMRARVDRALLASPWK